MAISNETSRRRSELGPLQDVRAFLRLPFLHEHWYVAGLRDEFGDELIAKTLLGRSIVFYRKQQGEVAALQNRCAHRAFPLSESRRIGDNVRCGYHGIVYDADGRIVEVPGQTGCPARNLRSYPVFERGPFAWIWMGKPDHADVSTIPDTGGLGKPGWRGFTGVKRLEASYLLMHENLADLSHFGALHASSLNVPPDWPFPEVDVEVARDGSAVDSWRATSDWDLVRMFFFGTDLSGRKVQARIGSTFLSPAMVCGYNRAALEDARADEQRHFDTEFNHYLTPETDRTAHYYYSLARNCGPETDAVDELLKKAVSNVFDEDVFATRIVQRLLDDDEHESADLHIASDKSGIAVRRALVDLANADQRV